MPSDPKQTSLKSGAGAYASTYLDGAGFVTAKVVNPVFAAYGHTTRKSALEDLAAQLALMSLEIAALAKKEKA